MLGDHPLPSGLEGAEVLAGGGPACTTLTVGEGTFGFAGPGFTRADDALALGFDSSAFGAAAFFPMG